MLQNFSYHVVRALTARGMIELAPSSEEQVVAQVATALSKVRHGSLVSSLSAALLHADGVVELWADDEQIKAVIDDLDPVTVRR